jgi:hypothetical protein
LPALPLLPAPRCQIHVLVSDAQRDSGIKLPRAKNIMPAISA